MPQRLFHERSRKSRPAPWPGLYGQPPSKGRLHEKIVAGFRNEFDPWIVKGGIL